MRRNKIRFYMSVHMKASSVTSYLSYLKKLEELFEADLDDIVCSSALFRMAENTLSDLSISGKITNKEKSDYISALNEYKAFYGFDQKTPGWEQGVSIETKKRKRMTTALRKVKLPSHLGFPPILPGISAEYRQYDLEEVSGLKESVLREASVILNDIPNYTKDGPIGHRPDIVLSDLEVKKEYLTCGSKVLERIKSTISGSTASIAEEIEAALQQNNPIARIKEIRKMSVGKLKIKVDPKSKKLIEAVEGIAENDTYSSTTFGTYHPGGKYISIYYRTFDASTSEKFHAQLLSVLAHELLHAYHHDRIGQIFNQQRLVGGSSNSLNQIRQKYDLCPQQENDFRNDDNNDDRSTETKPVVRANDLYDRVREALADFYSVIYCTGCWDYGDDFWAVARKRYELWVENFGTGWPYAHALFFMRRLAPSKKEIEVDKDIEPDFETELGRFGSLKHYENVFKETHSSLKAALELLEQGV